MRIIVIGESCLDRFIYVETKRLSPEAPVPVLTPIETTENKGMSGNVVENLKSLNKDLHIIHWYQNKDITKTRYVDKKSNHMFLRVDEGESDIEPLELNISKLNSLKNVDAVIIIGDDLVNKFDFVKLNESEFSKHNFNDSSLNKLLITLGSNGAKHQSKIYPSPSPKETIDVSGAGDTFTSSFTLKYLETKDVEESIIFANKMASIVVSKRGVATP